ncbi:hypothetical protein MY3957_005286 [Beauveria namnaoensis]
MATYDSQTASSPPTEKHTDSSQASAELGQPENHAATNGGADLSKAPDGGLEAWLVAGGAFCVFFCCLGFSNSFGVLADYYIQHQLHGTSPSKLAWIVLQGILQGLLQFPSMAAVSQFFDVNRAAAIGVAVSGSSIGGIIMPMALSKMLNGTNLGFGWSIRVIGFLMLPFLVVAVFTVKARLPPRARAFWLSEAFRDPKLVVLTLATFFVFIGMFLPLFFIPTYATMRGMQPTLAGYLSAILNASSTFGRIIPGVMADKLGKLNVYSVGAVTTAIVIFCMNEAKSNPALIVYAVIFGFTSGTIISGASVAFTVCCPDVRDVGTYAGMGMAFAALGGLVGPPLDGVLVEHYKGNFFQAAMFSGSVCLFGGCLAYANKWFFPQGLLGRA